MVHVRDVDPHDKGINGKEDLNNVVTALNNIFQDVHS